MDSYLTTTALSEGLYKEKGSKFFSFLVPIQSIEQADKILKEYRKKYYDARHVCYAFIQGMRSENTRSSDDGEPSNTAGAPILGQLKSKSLTNVLAIVVRYSGGTKLGVPGLINAYKTATLEAIDESLITEKLITKNLTLSFGYEHLNTVMQAINKFELEIVEQEQTDRCVFTLGIRLSIYNQTNDLFNEIYGIDILTAN